MAVDQAATASVSGSEVGVGNGYGLKQVNVITENPSYYDIKKQRS